MSNQIDGKKFNFTKLKQQSNTIVIYQIAKIFFIFRFFFFSIVLPKLAKKWFYAWMEV